MDLKNTILKTLPADHRWQIHFLDEVDSTNIWAGRLAREGAPEGTICIADHQLKGKGSRGRSWESPKGEGIFMSLVLRPEIRPEEAPMLTLLCACSLAAVLDEEFHIPVEIKWPNDLVLNKKKVTGILTEMSAQPGMVEHCIVGVGINVGMEHFPKELEDKATSLYLETGSRPDRGMLIGRFLRQFEIDYAAFLKAKDLSPFKERYEDHLVNIGEQVRIISGGVTPEWRGEALGIDSFGALLVKTDEGQIKKVVSGEVSVRGLYSYT